MLVGYFRFGFKKFVYTVLICVLFSILVLGIKKIYRDYMHYGGMDKLNYKYEDQNTTYAKKFDYRNVSDFFLKQKLEFLIFNKSYLYSNICGYGHEYKSDGGDIEDLISRFVFKDGEITKGSLDLKILNDFPKLKKFIEQKLKLIVIFFSDLFTELIFFLLLLKW